MKYNDYELVNLIREGNEDASNILYNKYKPIIIKKSEDAIFLLSHHGIEINDIMQEGYIGLERAINNFIEDEDSSFYTFAIVCIENSINNFIKKNLTIKSRVLNNAIEIDNYVENSVQDVLNIEDFVISSDYYDELFSFASKELTKFELQVFKLKIDNYSTGEISRLLNKDVKSIYNTIHRIKEKVKKFINIDL